jgi:hypothetical protein
MREFYTAFCEAYYGPERYNAPKSPTAPSLQPHEMTRNEYDTHVKSIQPRPTDYLKVGKTTVVQNPTQQDYRFVSDQVRQRFPQFPKGEPTTRSTYDKEGNQWIWPAHEGMHADIEPHITKQTGAAVNQNFGIPHHSEHIRDALRSGLKIPEHVQAEYPQYKEFFTGESKYAWTAEDERKHPRGNPRNSGQFSGKQSGPPPLPVKSGPKKPTGNTPKMPSGSQAETLPDEPGHTAMPGLSVKEPDQSRGWQLAKGKTTDPAVVEKMQKRAEKLGYIFDVKKQFPVDSDDTLYVITVFSRKGEKMANPKQFYELDSGMPVLDEYEAKDWREVPKQPQSLQGQKPLFTPKQTAHTSGKEVPVKPAEKQKMLFSQARNFADALCEKYVKLGFRTKGMADSPGQQTFGFATEDAHAFRNWTLEDERKHPRSGGGQWARKGDPTAAGEKPLPLFQGEQTQDAARLFRDEQGGLKIPNYQDVSRALGADDVKQSQVESLFKQLGLPESSVAKVFTDKSGKQFRRATVSRLVQIISKMADEPKQSFYSAVFESYYGPERYVQRTFEFDKPQGPSMLRPVTPTAKQQELPQVKSPPRQEQLPVKSEPKREGIPYEGPRGGRGTQDPVTGKVSYDEPAVAPVKAEEPKPEPKKPQEPEPEQTAESEGLNKLAGDFQRAYQQDPVKASNELFPAIYQQIMALTARALKNFKLTGDKDLEDFQNETATTAFEKLANGEYDESGSFAGLVYAIARYKAMDAGGKKKTLKTKSIDAPDKEGRVSQVSESETVKARGVKDTQKIYWKNVASVHNLALQQAVESNPKYWNAETFPGVPNIEIAKLVLVPNQKTKNFMRQTEIAKEIGVEPNDENRRKIAYIARKFREPLVSAQQELGVWIMRRHYTLQSELNRRFADRLPEACVEKYGILSRFWDAAKHPRGNPENRGQFKSTHGSSPAGTHGIGQTGFSTAATKPLQAAAQPVPKPSGMSAQTILENISSVLNKGKLATPARAPAQPKAPRQQPKQQKTKAEPNYRKEMTKAREEALKRFDKRMAAEKKAKEQKAAKEKRAAREKQSEVDRKHAETIKKERQTRQKMQSERLAQREKRLKKRESALKLQQEINMASKMLKKQQLENKKAKADIATAQLELKKQKQESLGEKAKIDAEAKLAKAKANKKRAEAKLETAEKAKAKAIYEKAKSFVASGKKLPQAKGQLKHVLDEKIGPDKALRAAVIMAANDYLKEESDLVAQHNASIQSMTGMSAFAAGNLIHRMSNSKDPGMVFRNAARTWTAEQDLESANLAALSSGHTGEGTQASLESEIVEALLEPHPDPTGRKKPRFGFMHQPHIWQDSIIERAIETVTASVPENVVISSLEYATGLKGQKQEKLAEEHEKTLESGGKEYHEHLADLAEEKETQQQQVEELPENQIPWDDRYENIIARIDSGANDIGTDRARSWLNAGKLNSPADLQEAVRLGAIPLSATELTGAQEEDEFNMFSMPHHKATKEFYSHLAAAYYGGKV